MGDREDVDNSVYYLITELCKSLAKQENKDYDENAAAVSRLRTKSFQILLKHSPTKHNGTFKGKSCQYDALREMQIHIFGKKLSTNGDSEECAQIDAAFAESLEIIEEEPYFIDGPGRNVLEFLLALPDIDGNQADSLVKPTEKILLPRAFSLDIDYRNPKNCSRVSTRNVLHPRPEYFKPSVEDLSKDNPFLPRYLFNPHRLMLRIEEERTPRLVERSNDLISFTGAVRQLWSSTMRISADAFQLFQDDKMKIREPKSHEDNLALPSHVNVTKLPEAPRIFSWNWEHLGCFGVLCTKPFISESKYSLQLQNYIYERKGHNFEAKVIKEVHLIRDLKSLIVGIQSDLFQLNDDFVFTMHPNVTVEDVLPTTMETFVVDFLECGSSYKSLLDMIAKRNYRLQYNGFMFKAVCSAVDEYLLTFRQFVFAAEDNNLLAFYKRMKKMMRLLVNLSWTLSVRSQDTRYHVPMGSEFLGYLYREIMRLTDKEFIALLIFMLKRCCHVYVKYLQKWIFEGVLDDPCNELFIGFVDHYRPATKHFYDKAYYIRREAVPGFFQGFEEKILQCGKYTMLLATYKSNHPIFNVKCPPISVCLSFEEIHQLESSCVSYYERGRQYLGSPVTIESIFESRRQKKLDFARIAVERSRENVEKWASDKELNRLAIATEKHKLYLEITAQVEDAKQRRRDERRANVELELKLRKEQELMEDERLAGENELLRKRIEYYQELNKLLEGRASSKDDGSTTNRSDESCSMSNSQTQDLHSACSSDFISCVGDDDGNSEYVECLSQFKSQKLVGSEISLDKAVSNEGRGEGDGGQYQPPPRLQRCISDIINSNTLSETGQSARQHNRDKVMSGNNMALCVQQQQQQQREQETQPSSNEAPDIDDGNSAPIAESLRKAATGLSEAQRNKLRILTQDFDMHVDGLSTKSMPDINLNSLPESDLTAVQRNRKRMMHGDELFAEYNKNPLVNRPNFNLNLGTDLSRNRRKVLESEFNILTGANNRTTVEELSPMSTASDSTTGESMMASGNGNDVVNGGSSEALRLDVALANPSRGVSCSSSALPEETPESALNTAGLEARKGFQFPSRNQPIVIKPPTIIETPDEEDITAATRDYTVPYERCLEILQSNFKCPPLNPVFRLGSLNPKDKSKSVDFSSCASPGTTRELNLNTMNAITLTEFLQKSVTMPMITHLRLAQDEVMRVFLVDLNILDHMRSLRNYFFMMNGEFGAILCEGIIAKLEGGMTPQRLLGYQMLHSIVDNALNTSITGHDKNSENLSFIVDEIPDEFDLTSPDTLDMLSLSYRIDWPLNLVLNPESMEKYATIFRYLFKVRRISWVLEHAYQLLKESAFTCGKEIQFSPQYRHVQQIRHKFYHFIHSLKNHITANALLSSWKKFKDDLINVQCIEQLYRRHTIYIKRIMFLCMLNRSSAEFHNAVENLFKVSLRFYRNLKSGRFKIRNNEEHFTHSRYRKILKDENDFDKLLRFAVYLGKKIVRRGYQEELGVFIDLIDFNQYYTAREDSKKESEC